MNSLISLMSTDVAQLYLTDTVAHAFSVMDEYEQDCLVVLDRFYEEVPASENDFFTTQALSEQTNLKYLGQICRSDLLNLSSDSVLISELSLKGTGAFLNVDAHWLDALAASAASPVGMIAIIDVFNGSFLGSVLSNDLLYWISQSYAINQAGGILELLISERDYSLSQISRLVESNGIKIIYSSVLTLVAEPNKLILVLKFNTIDISPVVATLERFGYLIYGRYYKIENKNIDQERLDILLKYLSI